MSRARGKPIRSTNRPARPPLRDTAPEPPLGAAGRALWITLAILLAARTAAALTPNMWAWSLNLQRFLDPAVAWGTGLVAALILVPGIAGALAPAAVRSGMRWRAAHGCRRSWSRSPQWRWSACCRT